MQHPTKKCSTCGEEKPKTEFYPHGTKNGKPRISHRCKSCDNGRKRNRVKTKSRLISSIYSQQKINSEKRGHHQPEYSSKELKEWVLKQEVFHKLYDEWVESGRPEMKIPSIDRLDDSKGYSFNNIRIVTWQVNLKKAAQDVVNGVRTQTCVPTTQLTLDGAIIKRFHSRKQAQRETGVSVKEISLCANGKRYTAGGFKWVNT